MKLKTYALFNGKITQYPNGVFYRVDKVKLFLEDKQILHNETLEKNTELNKKLDSLESLLEHQTNVIDRLQNELKEARK